ncbi:ABC transporter permease [Actinoplanes philippinensis]|uniref:Peptide/nickel transport system permease protein n=1 Tax=Actinoplanes philippinensis TaxID=35752 RepID=A0A1I2I965_9ACTN|nr:ABC transporter permease [Actinoplanes philippinensis]GIE78462.1 ABC transporter permease [Actinoplanes philippinensis]SFF38919.1 peptide/nickel transport system permease protein [Actinoplanes philippinensis]
MTAAVAVRRRAGTLPAGFFLLLVAISAVTPDLFTPYDPYATVPAEKLLAPSAAHVFGTDELGRDQFTRVLYGATHTIGITAAAVGLALIAGLVVGVLSGLTGGWPDIVVMRAVDVLVSLPRLLLALLIVTAFGFGAVPTTVAVAAGIFPGLARVARAETLKIRTLPYVEAARAGGASWLRSAVRHVLPHSWAPVLALALLDAGTAILVISTMSFLGLGPPPPAAEWGGLIAQGRDHLVAAPWLTLLPGVFVGLVLLSLDHLVRSLGRDVP